MCACASVCVCVCVCVSVCACVCVCVCGWVGVCVCGWVGVGVCLCVYIRIYRHTCIYTLYIYIHSAGPKTKVASPVQRLKPGQSIRVGALAVMVACVVSKL